MKLALWLSLFIVFYAFFGYGILLFVLVKIKRLIKGTPQKPVVDLAELPTCTMIVAAYNEEDFIAQKIENTLQLNYPEGKLQLYFVTDGSTDRTAEIIAHYPQITLFHKDGRSGKLAAVHRIMPSVTTEVVVFTDANTFLNADALLNICRHYSNPKVGAVAGEKRVHADEAADATAGEGFYWKYESKLKTWDSELGTVVGAAGELFSIRTNLYREVPPNSIIEDFMISLLVAADGYKVAYEPEAYATETGSESVGEELKRKIRIAAGGIQSIIWLKKLLNPFYMPLLTFQYVSHRVLRWTVVPFLMILAFILNMVIVASGYSTWLYELLLLGQVMFYAMALLGWLLARKEIKVKILFIPYYFCMMNYAVIRGIFRYISGTQSAVWEKAKRK
ncbi:glycosyltransferase family 2 protein [Mucilaginibacter sp. RS28]|uniref:Glycosyltransferase family 2 protein n=1 Tax=Mucilaginibacter straminoryzae TaxID=2932774 RepID=A0A9X1X766_9SPHI|nr:glycosyltransferase family 2 protein [Mucilaginibacter straminoryzae]MCJ8211836.1 glycosyltransferase family 2 protein [Mucilaginibacter straminoryzae]